MKSQAIYEQLYKTGSKLKGWKSLPILEKQRQMQWHSKETIQAQAGNRLLKMLEHAYRNVPYYRGLFESSGFVQNGDIQLERFRMIPMLDKDVMRAQGDNMRAEGDYPNGIWNKSGGSTGEPGRFFQDEGYRDYSRANKFLFDEWTGTRIGDKRVWLWGSERDLFYGKESVTVRLGNWVNRRIQLNTYRMTEERIRNYVDTINRFKPDQILSYVQSIEELTRFIENNELKVLSPKSIMVTAGTLFPEVRDKVEQVFGAPIFNRYGSREVGDMASECDHHHGLHVVPNTHYIEILREDGTPCEPGETGEIVVTLLSNYAMPLIRYRIGDRGAWATQACTCGRNLPLLERVEGRVVDIIRTLHGNVIDGTVFNKIFYFRKWINKFQVVQEEADKFTISIVPESMTDSPERKYADDLKDIQLMLEQTMKHPVAIDFRFVPDIPPSASGKYRYIMSKVDSP